MINGPKKQHLRDTHLKNPLVSQQQSMVVDIYKLLADII